jgi:thioredoxin 1
MSKVPLKDVSQTNNMPFKTIQIDRHRLFPIILRTRLLLKISRDAIVQFYFPREKIMSANLAEFSDDAFEEDVLKSNQLVVVDFWAPWCGPCKLLAPKIEELAETYAGRVKVGKLNIDHHQQIAGQYGISSIPTVLFFKGGQRVATCVGNVPPTELIKNVEANL